MYLLSLFKPGLPGFFMQTFDLTGNLGCEITGAVLRGCDLYFTGKPVFAILSAILPKIVKQVKYFRRITLTLHVKSHEGR